MKKLLICLLALSLVGVGPCALAAPEADPAELPLNCMAIVVGKDASATGRVLVGHNEDDDGRCVVRHGYVEAQAWPEGATLPAEEGRAAIPQAAETCGYFWSQFKGANGGLSGADAFLNEHGVYLVSDNNAESKEFTFDDSRLTDGGIEYNLRRAVAERAKSAREALNIIIDLVETWGYAPSGRAYTVADRDEAFMIQIVSGKHYVAARVPDDMVAVMPNHYTFHGLDEYEEMYYSDDIVTYAIEKGWYAPAVEGDYSDFDFAKAYQEMDSYLLDYNVLRQQHANELLLGRPWDAASEGTPFAVRPAEKVTVEKVAQILSTHYEGTADDAERFGPGAAPHDTRVRRICTGTTLESAICEFQDDVLTTTLWMAFGRPCELPYVPLHPLTGVLPSEIDQMADPAKAMAEHLQRDDGAMVYQQDGWQKFRDFQNALEMVYEGEIEGVKALKDRLHADCAQRAADVTAEAAALIAAGQAEQAAALLAESDQALTTGALEALTDHANEHFRMATIEEGAPISLSAPEEAYTLTFALDAAPVEASLIFGMGGTNARLKYATAQEGSLVDLGGGRYSASFDANALLDNSAVRAGTFDFILGGTDAEGRAFAGMTLVAFAA